MKKNIILVFLVALLVPVSSQALPGFMEERMGTMSGQVMYQGQPLASDLLAFFNVNKGLPPLAGNGGRAPDARTFSDKDGKFSLRLSQGSYYIGVLHRGEGDGLGPPRVGELYYFADGGEGKLRRLPVESHQDLDHGAIAFALPGVFGEKEDSFTVTGMVVKGAGDDEPYSGAIVTAKAGKSSKYRPDYVSSPTGADGRFLLTLPPGRPFVLLARSSITGSKPNPGDDIGKYGASSLQPQIPDMSQLGPPPGVEAETPVRVAVAADEQITIKGEKGQVISGLIIHMYKMPDQKAIKENIQKESTNDSNAPDYYNKGAALQNLLFATNKAVLQGNYVEELDQWVKFLQGKPDIHIEVNGYTDNVGSEQYNQQLSEKRAQVVGSYLVDKGIDPGRIVAVGYGEASPVADNKSEEGRSKNRRVAIQFVK